MNPDPVLKALHQLNAYVGHVEAGMSADTDIVECALSVLQKSAISSENLPTLRKLQGRVSLLQESFLFKRIFSSLLEKMDQSGYVPAVVQEIINSPPISLIDTLGELSMLFQLAVNPKALQTNDPILPKERTLVIIQAITTLVSRVNPSSFLQGIQNIPSIRRTPSIKEAISLLRAIQSIQPDQRADVIEKAIPLLQSISNWSQIENILPAIANILPDQRADVIEKAIPLLQGIPTEHLKVSILGLLNFASIEQVLSLFQGISDPLAIEDILRAVKGIPPDQRADVIKQAASLLLGISNGCQRALILQAVTDIPPDQRANIIKQAAPLLQGISNEYRRVAILQAVKGIHPDQIASVIKQLIPFFHSFMHQHEREAILQAIKNIPQDQRADIIEKALSPLQDISDSSEIEEFLFLLPFIPSDKRSEAMSILLQSQERTLYHLFLKNESIKEASHGYLLARLDLLSSEKEAVKELVSSILEAPEIFAVSTEIEEDPLIQKAIALKIALDPTAQSDPKNPYKIYQALQAQEPLLDLSPPSYEGFSLDPQGLRNNVDRYEFTLQKIPPKTFQDLFTHLQGRLEDPAVCKEVEAAFPRQDPHKFERALNAKEIVASLEENILRGPFIPRYLQIQKLNEKVPSTTFYLYGILEALCKMSQTTSSSDPLSEQEIALLSFADAVQSCSTGQQDGISNYYRYVDKSSPQEKEGEEALFLQISYSIQHVLQQTFASHSLLKTLTRENVLFQESHQTLYLKNRLYKQVGLKHHLAFDLHTHFLYDPLLQASPSDLLKEFFEECTLEKMADQVEKDLQELLKTKPGLMGLLSTILRKEGFSKEMVWNEKTEKLELTSKGICALLKYFNYLKKEGV